MSNRPHIASDQQLNQIARQLMDSQPLSWLRVDPQWVVKHCSDNFGEFGFPDMQAGDQADESLEFLTGMDASMALVLPIVLSPTGYPVAINILPDPEGGATITLRDAAHDFEQRQLLQQQANENQLLLDEQRRLNARLEEAARLQSLFLSGVSHEFRTPLSAIIGYTDLLLASANAADTEHLSAIARSSRHLLSLVENLLDHGKAAAGEIALNPQACEMEVLLADVQAVMQPLAESKDIELVISKQPEPLPACIVDESRLRQCLINIVGNAVKFTDHGQVSVDMRWQDDQLNVVVTDTGIGIDAEHLQRVRQPFWQADHSGRAGTGLGLTITESIIELQGGSLRIDSQSGQGTQVSFDLPAFATEIITGDAVEEVTLNSSPLHFLLAEDDDDIAQLVIFLLEEQGMQVTHVANGALAVEAAMNSAFDVILMDLQMPVLDGYGAIKQLRDNDVQVPIIVMTAAALEVGTEHEVLRGADAWLTKPVKIAELLSLADQLTSLRKVSGQ